MAPSPHSARESVATYRRRRALAALGVAAILGLPAAAGATQPMSGDLHPAAAGSRTASADAGGSSPARAERPSDIQTGAAPASVSDRGAVRTGRARIDWRPSVAVGEPFGGRLVRGVKLPAQGRDWFTWDSVLQRKPNRGWRRWGTSHLLRVVLRVARAYRKAHPGAPRLTIGDLSRTHGGEFGARFGGIGHASHQNGLDIDIYYPRVDRRELPPFRVAQVDQRLSQDLVTRFVRAGAEYVFVGPSLTLRGPRDVVQKLVHHDNHLHVRLRNPLR